MRELAAELGINLHTVHKAYQTLRDDGVLRLRLGRVPRVAPLRETPADRGEIEARITARLSELITEAFHLGLSQKDFRSLVDDLLKSDRGGRPMSALVRLHPRRGPTPPPLPCSSVRRPRFSARRRSPRMLPTRFGPGGVPVQWGSGWIVPLGVLFFGGLVGLLVGAALDDAWARHERRKRFNPLVVVDELILAGVLAVAVQHAQALSRRPPLMGPVPVWVWFAGGLAVLAAVVIEAVRPSENERPEPSRPGDSADRAAELVGELQAAQAADRPWLFWSVQKPRYLRLFPLFGCGLIALGILGPAPLPLRVVVLVGGATALVLMSGGIRTSVTPGGVAVRAGLLGLPILRLGARETMEAVAYAFNPLAEFAGYGYRLGVGRSAGVRAINLEGGTGVLLTTAKGRRYLIGTDRPEQMAAAVKAARRALQP